MSRIAERNRAMKRTLESAFGKGKIRVRGARGTAYGYVDVDIDWTPLDSEQAEIMRAHCKALLRAAGIDLGHAYTDDSCQWETDQTHIGFNPCRYFRTMRMSDGTFARCPIGTMRNGYGRSIDRMAWVIEYWSDRRLFAGDCHPDFFATREDAEQEADLSCGCYRGQYDGHCANFAIANRTRRARETRLWPGFFVYRPGGPMAQPARARGRVPAGPRPSYGAAARARGRVPAVPAGRPMAQPARARGRVPAVPAGRPMAQPARARVRVPAVPAGRPMAQPLEPVGPSLPSLPARLGPFRALADSRIWRKSAKFCGDQGQFGPKIRPIWP